MAKILVADRDQILRTVVRRMLQVEGHQVVVAMDLKTALLTLDRDDIELVLAELQIATTDDFQLIRRCQIGEEKTPIILLSGGNWKKLRSFIQEGPPSHYIGFLEKPFGRAGLTETVADALD